MRERNRRFSLWINDKEFEYLTKQAEIAGLKKEPFIRKLIMGKEIRPRPPDAYYELIKKINPIGININQIAHIANAERHISDQRIDEAVKMVGEIMTIVRRG